MVKKRISITDIAKETGYSIATVSRVVNKTNSFYSEKTRRIVEDAVERLGYRPNLMAKGLKESRTYNIAYLVPQIDDYYAGIYNSMLQLAEDQGYSIVILASNYSVDLENRYIGHILNKQYDGVIVATGLLQPELNCKLEEVFHGMPVVYIEGIKAQSGVCCVSIDVEEICRKAVNYLISLGHKKIAYVSAPCRFETLSQRYNGYVRAFADNNLPVDRSHVFFDKGLEMTKYEQSYEVMSRVIKGNDFTALFIMSDWAAFTSIQVASRLGLSVPKDLSIIGFDNLPFTEFSQPAITTISQQSDQIGAKSIELMLAMLENRPTRNVNLEAKLILRGSVARVSG